MLADCRDFSLRHVLHAATEPLRRWLRLAQQPARGQPPAARKFLTKREATPPHALPSWDEVRSALSISLARTIGTQLRPWLGPLCAVASSAALLDAFGMARLLDCQPICDASDVEADFSGCSPLYGELLPEAVTALAQRFCPRVVFDLGMGHGKLALQLFAQEGVHTVVGVELLAPRFSRAEAAACRLAEVGAHRLASHLPGERTVLCDELERSLDLRCGSFLAAGLSEGLERADLVVCNFAIEPQQRTCAAMASLLSRLRSGCVVVSLGDLSPLAPAASFAVKPPERMQLATSWCPRGDAFWVLRIGEREGSAHGQGSGEYTEAAC